jgi:hypothetical protein
VASLPPRTRLAEAREEEDTAGDNDAREEDMDDDSSLTVGAGTLPGGRGGPSVAVLKEGGGDEGAPSAKDMMIFVSDL